MMEMKVIFDQFNIIQAPSEARGLGRKNWRKEIVCIMRVCDRGGKIPVVCLYVVELLSAPLTNPAEIFWECWGTYWLCISQKLA